MKKSKPRGRARAAAGGKAEAHARNIIRIDTGKIDQLINHVGELVISNAGVVQLSRNGSKDDLEDSIENMSRLIENIRESAMTIRMVPIAEAFARFNRVVRDLSRELGKEIELIVEGGDTEIDKSIMDSIIDPLMHIIRNSIDHGIEGRDERAALGKPEKGRITLRAFQEGGALILECGDDGRGLDSERISCEGEGPGTSSRRRGRPDSDIYKVIFMPGFSTSEKVTSVSGRGVGMDVVRKNVEFLRGSIIDQERKEYRHRVQDPAPAHPGHHRRLHSPGGGNQVYHPPLLRDGMPGHQPGRRARRRGVLIHRPQGGSAPLHPPRGNIRTGARQETGSSASWWSSMRRAEWVLP